MTVAAATRTGGVPEPIRRIGWRAWMVLRVPVYAVGGVFLGVIVLGILVMFGVMYGSFAYMGGALAGLAVAMIGSLLPGVTPTEGYSEIGGQIAVALLVLYYLGAGINGFVGALREASLGARTRRVIDATVTEWREAAERWPSRRPAPEPPAPTTWPGGLDDTADDRCHDEDDVSTPEPLPPSPSPSPPARPVPVLRPPDLRPRVRAEPIVAWRGWSIEFQPAGPFNRQPVLASLGVAATWDTASVTAECWRDVRHQHTPDAPVPAVECSCGLWAVKRRDQVPSYGGDMRAFGPVELTGRVLEFEKGYRAEQAHIVGPLLVVLECGSYPCAIAPTVILSNANDEMPACESHRGTYEDADVFDIDDFVVQLQARLELRYGVEANIRKGTHTWT